MLQALARRWFGAVETKVAAKLAPTLRGYEERMLTLTADHGFMRRSPDGWVCPAGPGDAAAWLPDNVAGRYRTSPQGAGLVEFESGMDAVQFALRWATAPLPDRCDVTFAAGLPWQHGKAGAVSKSSDRMVDALWQRMLEEQAQAA